MDVYQILMQDHRLIQQIFSEIEQTEGREVDRREQLFAIRNTSKGLQDYAIVDENTFYLEIEKYSETQELAADAFDDPR
jgi:CRISPR/Cas system endoribonuclease Cas6 (RAMP superfamily)